MSVYLVEQSPAVYSSFYNSEPNTHPVPTTRLFPPSPTITNSSRSSPIVSDCASPITSDCEDNSVSMDQVNTVKELLNMFPPPISASEFIGKNPFKGTDGHVKRPSNNFILFRKIAHDQKNQTAELTDYNEREFSKIIGKIWKGLTVEETLIYKNLGKQVAEKHREMFPKYKYSPKRDRAAWKHFTPENNTSNPKPKIARKRNNIKQQKHQETTPLVNYPKVDISVPQQQQQTISPSSELDFSLPTTLASELDSMYYQYPALSTEYFPKISSQFTFQDEWTNSELWNNM